MLQALLAVFQILIADNWPVDLGYAFKGTGGSFGVFAFSIIIVFVGTYVMLTLFVAILLDRFAGQEDGALDIIEQVALVRSEN